MRFGPAEAGHHRVLAVDHQDTALAYYPDPVGHLLGFLDVVGGQDDRRSTGTHFIDDRPHALAQLDIHSGGGLVEKQEIGVVGQRLRDEHTAFHPPGKRHDPFGSLVPQAQRSEDLFDARRIGWQTEQSARIGNRAIDRLEHIGRKLLRHQSDARPRPAPIARHVVTERADMSGGRVHQPADRADQGGLARPVGAEEGEYLACADREIDTVQRGEPAVIRLGQAFDFEDGFAHARTVTAGAGNCHHKSRSGNRSRSHGHRRP